MDPWRPVTRAELEALIDRHLAACEEADRVFFAKIRIAPVSVSYRRGRLWESVFVVARDGAKAVFYDDAEDAFEVAPRIVDGVLDFDGTGRFDLAGVLRQLRSGGR